MAFAIELFDESEEPVSPQGPVQALPVAPTLNRLSIPGEVLRTPYLIKAQVTASYWPLQICRRQGRAVFAGVDRVDFEPTAASFRVSGTESGLEGGSNRLNKTPTRTNDTPFPVRESPSRITGAPSRISEPSSRIVEMANRISEMTIRMFETGTRMFEMMFRMFEMGTRIFEMAFRIDEMMARMSGMTSRLTEMAPMGRSAGSLWRF